MQLNQIINSNKVSKLTCKMFEVINLSWNSVMNYIFQWSSLPIYINSHNDSWRFPAPGKMVFHRYILFSSYIFSSPSKHATAGLPHTTIFKRHNFQKKLFQKWNKLNLRKDHRKAKFIKKLFNITLSAHTATYYILGCQIQKYWKGKTTKQHFQKCLNPKRKNFRGKICNNNFFIQHFFLLTLRT